MVRSKVIPRLTGDFIRWLNSEEFIVYIGDVEMIGHKDHWEGEFMHKCDTCKVHIETIKSNEPACCKWFIDNVVVGGKSVKDCDVYEPINEEKK